MYYEKEKYETVEILKKEFSFTEEDAATVKITDETIEIVLFALREKGVEIEAKEVIFISAYFESLNPKKIIEAIEIIRFYKKGERFLKENENEK
jgi:hypothetical protein